MAADPYDQVAYLIDHRQEVDGPDGPRDGGGGGAEPRELDGLPEDCPVQPLGVEQDVCWYLDGLHQLRAVKHKEHTRLNIVGLFVPRPELLRAYWPRKKFNESRSEWEITGVHYEDAAEALMQACGARGVWDVWGRVRGPGAWLGERGELVLHVGSGVHRGRSPAGQGAGPDMVDPVYERPGRFGEFVYPAYAAQPRPAEAPQPAGERGPAAELLRLLKTWNWKRRARAEDGGDGDGAPDTDALLLLGWICAAMIGGALTWRPACWITGDAGTGKSTLQELIKHLLGADQGLLQASDPSAASIWQTLGHASLPVAVDELEPEADSRRADGVIKLARQASSGGLIMRGGQDHHASRFVVRSCFLFSSILIPPLNRADASRLAILELGELDRTRGAPRLEPRAMGELGRRLRRRMLDGWPRFAETLELWRAELVRLGHRGRGADVFGTLLACADLALNDRAPDSDSLEDWCRPLAAAGLAELEEDEADWARLLEHLRTSVLDVFRGGVKRTVGHLVLQAHGDLSSSFALPDPQDRTTDANDALAAAGMRVLQRDGKWFLAVANRHVGLARLFEGTHWAARAGASVPWAQSLARAPGAERPKGGLKFAGVQSRCALVPLALVLPEGGE